jgi:hypothetical protein
MDTVVVVVLALAFGLYLARERTIARSHKEEHRALLAEVLQELVLLRNGLVESGIAERSGRPPPPPPGRVTSPAASSPAPVWPPAAPAPLPVKPPSPPPAGGDAEVPSTKPSHSHKVPMARSSPRPVCFDDQVRRALARMEGRFKVPSHLEERFLARLRARGAELDFPENDGPTDEQVAVMIQELYQAGADVRDARDAGKVRPGMHTLVSATEAPIVRRIAGAAKNQDGDGEATILRGGAPPDEDPDAARETGEEFTRVLTREPSAADAQIPGIEVVAKPRTGGAPHRPPRKIADALAGVPVVTPTSSPTRTAEAFATHGERRTLVDGRGLRGGAAPRPALRGPQASDKEGGETA